MTEEDYFDSGDKLFAISDGAEAIESFSKIIVLDPENVEAYNKRGLALRNLGRYEEAITDYDKAIKLAPNSAATYTKRGIAKQELGRHQEAIADYDKAIKLDPKNAAAYSNRGVSKQELRQHQKAIEDYDKAIELAPNNAAAYNNRGNAKTKLDRHQEAVEDYDKAIELDQDYANAYYNRGNAKANLERHQEASTDYDKAIELDPKNAKAYYNRGMLKRGLGQEAEALQDFKKANEIDPTVISKEQAAELQKDALIDKQKTKEVEGFQKIFEELGKTYDGMRNRWLRVSVLMVILTSSMLFALPTIDSCWELNLTSGAYNFYIIYIFFALITSFVIRQYIIAKRLMLDETNRLAMAKLFEKIQNSDIDKNEEYHKFIPRLIQSIVYSTRKDGNAEKGGGPALLQELTSYLKSLRP